MPVTISTSPGRAEPVVSPLLMALSPIRIKRRQKASNKKAESV
jgi:hypothetical protein